MFGRRKQEDTKFKAFLGNRRHFKVSSGNLVRTLLKNKEKAELNLRGGGPIVLCDALDSATVLWGWVAE